MRSLAIPLNIMQLHLHLELWADCVTRNTVCPVTFMLTDSVPMNPERHVCSCEP